MRLDPRILVVGEYPTSAEARSGNRFTGPAGAAFRAMMLNAGINLDHCRFIYITAENPLRGEMHRLFRPTKECKGIVPDVRGLYPGEQMAEGLNNVEAIIESYKPDLIIASGSYAMWALTDDCFGVGNFKGHKTATGIGNWRGSQIYSRHGIPLLPVYGHHDSNKVWPWMYKTKHDLACRYKRFIDNEWEDFTRNFIVNPDFHKAKSVLHYLIGQCKAAVVRGERYPIAVDIETRAFSIACIGFAWSVRDAICIPLMRADKENQDHWTHEEELELIRLMRILLTHPGIGIRGQNFLFDAQYIGLYWQIIPYIWQDTMIMQHLVYPGTELGLDNLSSMYCHYHRYWKNDGKEWQKDMNEEQLWIYNCRDCVVTYEAADELTGLIDYYHLQELWVYQQRQLQSLLRMMNRGVLINAETKHMARHDLDLMIEQYQEKLEALLPEEIWPRDPKKSAWYASHVQLREIFTEVFNYKPYFNRKTRKYSMDDSALEHYGKTEPVLRELCETLREYRSLSTFKTFTHMPLSPDGRMRSSYSPTAETFRWKSSSDVWGTGGNLQNLPKGNEDDA